MFCHLRYYRGSFQLKFMKHFRCLHEVAFYTNTAGLKFLKRNEVIMNENNTEIWDCQRLYNKRCMIALYTNFKSGLIVHYEETVLLKNEICFVLGFFLQIRQETTWKIGGHSIFNFFCDKIQILLTKKRRDPKLLL